MQAIMRRVLRKSAVSRTPVETDRCLQLLPRFLSSSASASQDVADVAIVGGGMVGAALAALLANNPLTASMRIVLLDQKPQASEWHPAPSPELRVSTVTPASIRALHKAGAWEAIERHSAPVATMQVWDASGGGCIRWHAQDAGMEHMGVVAENSLLQASLLTAMKRQTHAGCSDVASASAAGASSPASPSAQHASSSAPDASAGSGVQCLWPATIKGLHLPPFDMGSVQVPAPPIGGPHSDHRSRDGSEGAAAQGNQLATLIFEDDTELKARLVVAADGGASRIRQLAGFRTFGWKYNQRAVVATVQLEGGSTSTAWQRFLPTGPLALLPVRNDLANIVWSTTPEAARALEQLSPEAFAAAANKALQDPVPSPGSDHHPNLSWLSALQSSSASLAKATGSLYPGLPESSQYQPPPIVQFWVGDQPKSFPLQLQHSGRYVRPRLALIGDAAHSVHPLAGQGANLGFGDAEALADTIMWGRSCGVDPGDLLALQDHYEKPRQAANLAMTAALDGLARTFGIQAAPFAAARNLGLNLLNAAAPLRTSVMRIAMGL
ncbi:flavin-dependent monooxygenase [Dunaliella salina]|uniref:Ubiquinone biosynthesis monooxygenase COQ6, mitochondrial n=1 Tax=Dunaliella salina TaxID=3046 RepID=A0ABQ7GQF9_DUNSA|nr:flavin-dependent monooxygenase [Dunaliella salina]|eukprot:KAF5836845.1 flavin-dependent monooxygenase [Dunaliella salina]